MEIEREIDQKEELAKEFAAWALINKKYAPSQELVLAYLQKYAPEQEDLSNWILDTAKDYMANPKQIIEAASQPITRLEYVDPTMGHSKFYELELFELDLHWYYDVRWGRIGKQPQAKRNGPFATHQEATASMTAQQNAKLKKGYVLVEQATEGLDVLPDKGRIQDPVIDELVNTASPTLFKEEVGDRTAATTLSRNALAFLRRWHLAQGVFQKQLSAVETYMESYQKVVTFFPAVADTAVAGWLVMALKKLGAWYEFEDVVNAHFSS